MYSLDINDALLGAFIGIFVVGIGSSLFSFALLLSRSRSILALWWVTPLLSLAWLALFDGQVLTATAGVGAAAILFSNLLLQSRERDRLALVGTQLYLLLALYVVAFAKPVIAREDIVIFQISAVAFTILIGSLIQKIDKEQANELDLFYAICQDLRNLIPLSGCNHLLQNGVERLFAAIVNYDLRRGSQSETEWQKVLSAIDDLDRLGDSAISDEVTKKLRDRILRWSASCRDAFSTTQVSITVALSLATSVGILLARPDHLIGRLAAVLLTSSFVYVALRIFDFHRASRSFQCRDLSLRQFMYTQDASVVYIPKWLIEEGAIDSAALGTTVHQILENGDTSKLGSRKLPAFGSELTHGILLMAVALILALAAI